MKRYSILIVLIMFTLANSALAQQSDSSRTEYIQGSTAYELGSYQDALTHLKRSLNMNPDNAMANFTLGQTYEKLDSLSLAINYIKKAIQQDPNNKSFLTELAIVYKATGNDKDAVATLKSASKLDPHDMDVLYQLAQLQTLNKNYDESNQTLNTILRTTGPNLEIYYLKYNNFRSLGNRDSVIVQLERIRQMDPNNTGALQTLGQYYLNENQLGKAKEAFLQAMAKAPNDPRTAEALLNIYIRESKWDSAEVVLAPVIRDTSIAADQKAAMVQDLISDFKADTTNTNLKQLSAHMLDLFVENDKEDSHALSMSARFYAQYGNNDKAIKLFNRSLTQNPENDDDWFQYLQLLYMSGRYKDVIEQGIQATKYIPGNAFIDFLIGSSYTITKQPDNSILWLQKALEKPSRNQFKSIIYSSLADAYAAQRDWSPADSAYEQAIHFDPNNDNALNNYAYYLSERGNKLEYARKMATKALKISPTNSSYLDTMGWIFYKLGQYNDALHYVGQAIKNDSQNAGAEVMEHMGDIYQKLNDKRNAVKWWRKAFKKDPDRSYLKKKISSN